jgi:integrase
MTAEGKPRRPKGTGSIYERDGVVIGQYEVQTPEGKAKRKYVRGKDRKEVASKLAKAIAERDSGLDYDAVRGTVRERTWQRTKRLFAFT